MKQEIQNAGTDRPEQMDVGEIVVYQPDDITKLDVHIDKETVWLTQSQIAKLFGVGQPAISKHLRNIFASGELSPDSVHSILEYTASDGKSYSTGFYNLDAILSVGYRVNSRNATLFRQWANRVLKEYLIRGYSFNAGLQQLSADIDRRIEAHSRTLAEHDRRLVEQGQKIDFFVRTSLPPVEGIFYDGQIFDAYVFAADMIRSARSRLVLIDNYVDESVLLMLSKRGAGVSVEIRTGRMSQQLQLDIAKHNSQYEPIRLIQSHNIHDRFLIVDDTVFHLGASLKDLGKKLFAFSKMSLPAETLLDMVAPRPAAQARS